MQTSTTSASARPSRREFLKTSGKVLAGSTLAGAAALRAHPAGSDEIRVALIGCGGRGTGAAANVLGNCAHKNVKLVAVADAFAENAERCVRGLATQFQDKVAVAPERRFAGLDAYQQAMSTDADLVLLCTPPGFRPAMFEAAVKAGKHVFMEKPVAVDAPGFRRIKAANEEAKTRGLRVSVGHHLRHDKNHREVIAQIHDGLIGELTHTRAYFNVNDIWRRPRKPGMTEMQYQVNNWYHFVWLSGDHIVEQHVHGIDICNWLAQAVPVEAVGMGGRQVRVAEGIGELFDHHSVQYTYASGVQSFSECRQITGCWSSFAHHAHGTKGMVSFDGTGSVIIRLKGSEPQRLKPAQDGHQIEMDDLFAAWVGGKSYNEADWAADSTMSAILGRMATYSGKQLAWDDAIASNLDYAPERLAWDAEPRTKPGPGGTYSCATPGVTKAL
jgi:predicted dehydrogenase